IDRVEYIIIRLIKLNVKDNETIKLEELADSMYVSLSTVKNDMKTVKKILADYNIKVSIKHKQGLYLNSSEEDLIKCIIGIANRTNNSININDFLSEDVRNNIFTIKKLILNSLTKECLVFTDLEFKNVLNTISIYLSRDNNIKENFILTYIKEYKKQRNNILNSNDKKQNIKKSIKAFTENLKVATSIDISKDTVFEEYLYNHIDSMYKKMKLGIYQPVINYSETKIKYPFAFELAKIAKKTIENELNIEISEEEIANIAIHIGGALERASYDNEKKVFKTIIVCTSGVGTSMLLKAKLENIFKDKLEIVKIIPEYLVDYINVIDVDFVISTVPLKMEDIPVINISPILEDKEIKIIEKYIETENIYEDLNIKSLFDSSIFFVDLDLNNKEEIIKFMSNELVEKNYIDLQMKNSYLKREKIATTEIGNLVAIPHGASGTIYKNSIAIAILKNPIHWEVGKVRLVIMLAIDKDKVLDYEELFLNIYKRVDSLPKVISICENKSYQKFISMFR
ncbi:MAG: BglG family transcription antiterminator, partial [Peptostreptococcaceae bacterium]